MTILFILSTILASIMISKAYSLLWGLPFLALIIPGFIFIIYLLLAFPLPAGKTNVSQLIELTDSDQPELFCVIREIALETQSAVPHRVYTSNENNAFVFSESPLFSLLFYNKISLHIGYSLLSAIHTDELKAILAHEMGHIRHHSMSMGGYVYQFNKMLFDMLYAEKSQSRQTPAWVSIWLNLYRQILERMYYNMNRHFLGLSRVMEMEADQEAYNLSLGQHLSSYLLRNEFIDICFNRMSVIHAGFIKQGKKVKNIYPNFRYVLERTAIVNQLSAVDGIPMISPDFFRRFNKSKLVIEDQWSSHPSIQERIEHLKYIETHISSVIPANLLIRNRETLEEKLTSKYYQGEVSTNQPLITIKEEDFIRTYENESRENSLPDCFLGYYNNKNPYIPDEDELRMATKTDFNHLFNNETVNSVYELICLENDFNVLQEISAEGSDYRSFDYEGVRYSIDQASEVIVMIRKSIGRLGLKNTQNDASIFLFFQDLSKSKKQEREMNELYNNLQILDDDYPDMTALIQKMKDIMESVQSEGIGMSIEEWENTTEAFLRKIKLFKEHELYNKVVDSYIEEQLIAFLNEKENNHKKGEKASINIMVWENAIDAMEYVVLEAYFIQKKQLLDFQASLLEIN